MPSVRGRWSLEKGSGPWVAGLSVVHMLRLAHTLKGAARVVRQPPIAEKAHAVEDVLAPHREKGAGPVARAGVDRVLGLLDEMTALVAGLDAPPSAPQAAAAPHEAAKPARSDEQLKSVRVEIAEMDALLAGCPESHVHLAALRRDLEDLSRGRGCAARALVDLSPRGTRAKAVAEDLAGALAKAERNLTASLERAERETTEVGDRASQLRLLPANTVFPALERARRDAAQALSKTVRFETSGGEQRLEAHVLLALRDGLLHVVRNAVAHGIEPEGARAAAGKAPAGQVRVDVQRRGNRVAFACSDDGRGIDVEAVRRSASACGIVAAGLSDEQVVRGPRPRERRHDDGPRDRGLRPGDRPRRAPQHGLAVEGGRDSFEPARPRNHDRCLRTPLGVVDRGHRRGSEADRSSIPSTPSAARSPWRPATGGSPPTATRSSWRTPVLPFAPLAAPPFAVRRRARPARDGGRPWWSKPDRAPPRSASTGSSVGRASSFARSRRSQGPYRSRPERRSTPTATRCSSSTRGRFVDAAHATDRANSPVGAAPRVTPTILVIDDSLTTRMLEQSILESAGYRVELATSAEEGLAKARARNGEGAYGLFLVDVEMPGIDGFEFVARTRADPALRGTPAILVTSRDAPQDRRRGEDVGARAYIVKGEFDQGHLLKVIRQLIG